MEKQTAKLRFLFHKSIGEEPIGRLIVAWTWLLALFYARGKALKYNYTHEEVQTTDDDGNFRVGKRKNNSHYVATGGYLHPMIYEYVGECFSATTRGDANGVRFASASKILKHPERWDYIEVTVEAERLVEVLKEARKLVGAGYDYGYIISFLQPFIVQNDDDWACSEILNWFKWRLLVANLYKRISPRRAAYILSKGWGEPKPLVKKEATT